MPESTESDQITVSRTWLDALLASVQGKLGTTNVQHSGLEADLAVKNAELQKKNELIDSMVSRLEEYERERDPENVAERRE